MMEVRQQPEDGSATADERSLNELVKQLSEQSTRLARMEVELAKAELQQKGKQLGIGASAFGGAAAIGLYAMAALTATFILALAEGVDGWLAALIVALAYAAIAGVLAVVGRSRVQGGTPPTPERAIESSREDVEAAKRSAKGASA
jgi:hypothetical protein